MNNPFQERLASLPQEEREQIAQAIYPRRFSPPPCDMLVQAYNKLPPEERMVAPNEVYLVKRDGKWIRVNLLTVVGDNKNILKTP